MQSKDSASNNNNNDEVDEIGFLPRVYLSTPNPIETPYLDDWDYDDSCLGIFLEREIEDSLYHW